MFQFYRFRFHFRALAPVHLPPGMSANALRGGFGLALRDTAPAAVYRRLFEPGAPPGSRSPSGLAEWPRPFVFRTRHLDGQILQGGQEFSFGLHVFERNEPILPYISNALRELGERGIGAGRGTATLERIEQLDLNGAKWEGADSPSPPCVVSLDPETSPVERTVIRFVTPTELKSRGVLADRPEFPVLFARIRDRLSTLSALYGPGPLEIDFRVLGKEAESIRLVRADLTWDEAQRRSSRTGQVHPIGGFRGEAEYAGPLVTFLPWLRAARWTGVGRQTVWGKGEIHVTLPAPRPAVTF